MGGRPEGGADRCGAMHYATTSGIGSRIVCPAEKAMWEALRRTIECSSKPFCTDIEPAFLGVISGSSERLSVILFSAAAVCSDEWSSV